jgi:AhpC/TSA family protein/cytochrome c biogenesis DsbD-like protein
VELQRRVGDLKQRGLGLAAISYDSAATLKGFGDSRRITFPMLSDSGSAIIRRFGLLNTTIEPGQPTYGIPFPGTFIVDRKGVVRSRHFEEAYQERNTVAGLLVRQGVAPFGPVLTAETPHLVMTAAVSDEQVAPGTRLSLVFDVTPRRGMHVYAPGKHTYRVVRFTLDSSSWLRAHPAVYPPAEIYTFQPLDERVEVYQKPFRLVQDVTVLATREVQKELAGQSSIVVSGRLEYQACDDKVCYMPQSVPVKWTLPLKPLDRQ